MDEYEEAFNKQVTTITNSLQELKHNKDNLISLTSIERACQELRDLEIYSIMHKL